MRQALAHLLVFATLWQSLIAPLSAQERQISHPNIVSNQSDLNLDSLIDTSHDQYAEILKSLEETESQGYLSTRIEPDSLRDKIHELLGEIEQENDLESKRFFIYEYDNADRAEVLRNAEIARVLRNRGFFVEKVIIPISEVLRRLQREGKHLTSSMREFLFGKDTRIGKMIYPVLKKVFPDRSSDTAPTPVEKFIPKVKIPLEAASKTAGFIISQTPFQTIFWLIGFSATKSYLTDTYRHFLRKIYNGNSWMTNFHAVIGDHFHMDFTPYLEREKEEWETIKREIRSLNTDQLRRYAISKGVERSEISRPRRRRPTVQQAYSQKLWIQHLLKLNLRERTNSEITGHFDEHLNGQDNIENLEFISRELSLRSSKRARGESPEDHSNRIKQELKERLSRRYTFWSALEKTSLHTIDVSLRQHLKSFGFSVAERSPPFLANHIRSMAENLKDESKHAGYLKQLNAWEVLDLLQYGAKKMAYTFISYEALNVIEHLNGASFKGWMQIGAATLAANGYHVILNQRIEDRLVLTGVLHRDTQSKLALFISSIAGALSIATYTGQTIPVINMDAGALLVGINITLMIGYLAYRRHFFFREGVFRDGDTYEERAQRLDRFIARKQEIGNRETWGYTYFKKNLDRPEWQARLFYKLIKNADEREVLGLPGDELTFEQEFLQNPLTQRLLEKIDALHLEIIHRIYNYPPIIRNLMVFRIKYLLTSEEAIDNFLEGLRLNELARQMNTQGRSLLMEQSLEQLKDYWLHELRQRILLRPYENNETYQDREKEVQARYSEVLVHLRRHLNHINENHGPLRRWWALRRLRSMERLHEVESHLMRQDLHRAAQEERDSNRSDFMNYCVKGFASLI